MNEPSTEFGKRLRAARKHGKLTQVQLAEKAELAQMRSPPAKTWADVEDDWPPSGLDVELPPPPPVPPDRPMW